MGAEQLDICLDRPSLRRAREGRFPFFNRIADTFEALGWKVQMRGNGVMERMTVEARGGYALYHMEAPSHGRALTCRNTYLGAFWRIEKLAERWLWPVARAEYDPTEVDRGAALVFMRNWRKWRFDELRGVGDDGFTFVPLQGRLLEQRSFQAASPIRMLEEVLARCAGPVIATLHPKEVYSAEETAALEALARQNNRLTVQTGGSEAALKRCSRVVTENSSLALQGYFLKKPAVLFAGADFHHIAGSVPRDGIEAAFDALEDVPDFDGYLWWFFQRDVMNASHEDFPEQLLARLRQHGWPL